MRGTCVRPILRRRVLCLPSGTTASRRSPYTTARLPTPTRGAPRAVFSPDTRGPSLILDGISLEGDPPLAQLRPAGQGPGLLANTAQDGQKDAHQQRDHGDYDQQFDQRKSRPAARVILRRSRRIWGTKETSHAKPRSFTPLRFVQDDKRSRHNLRCRADSPPAFAMTESPSHAQ